MYNQESLILLEEKLGYEKWVLLKAISILEFNYGKISDSRYEFTDESITKIIEVSDQIGTGLVSELVQDMSPLLFSASYKILDMIIEWIICETDGTCPWSFSKKIARLNNMQTPLNYPPIFSTEPDILNILVGLYIKWVEYRNAITHGKWGTNINGNLIFDFTKNGIPYNDEIKFVHIMAFAECITLISDVLLGTNVLSREVVLMIKYYLDILEIFHQKQMFNVKFPAYFDVLYKSSVHGNKAVTVDLKKIRSCLEGDCRNRPYSFSLKISAIGETCDTIWKIPSINLPDKDTLELDDKWDQYRI